MPLPPLDMCFSALRSIPVRHFGASRQRPGLDADLVQRLTVAPRAEQDVQALLAQGERHRHAVPAGAPGLRRADAAAVAFVY